MTCNGTGWLLKTVIDETDIHYTARGNRIPVGASYGVPCPDCGSDNFLGGSGMPPKHNGIGYNEDFWKVYKTRHEKEIQIIDSFVQRYPDWKYGLYLWSDQRGTGKTRLSCALMTSIRLKYNSSIRFVSVPEYLYKIRSSFKDDAASVNHYIRELMESELLCLDDLGAEKRSDWTDQELFYLIDKRYQRGLKTIITSNFQIEHCPEDARLKDRIQEVCIEVHMPEQPVRMQKAQITHDAFLKNLGINI